MTKPTLIFMFLVFSQGLLAADTSLAERVLENSGLIPFKKDEVFSDANSRIFRETFINTFTEKISRDDLLYLDKVFASAVGKKYRETVKASFTNVVNKVAGAPPPAPSKSAVPALKDATKTPPPPSAKKNK